MTACIAYFCVAILLFGAAFHFYWGFGGRIAYEASIPRRLTGERLFEPPPWGGHLVGVVVTAACWPVLAVAQLVSFPFPYSWARYAVTLMAVGFIGRAFWGTPYGGFLKTYRNSIFARYDTYLYSPLFLVLGLELFYLLHHS